MPSRLRPRPQYDSLQEWMEQMGVKTELLARIAGIDRTHLGRILQHSVRCSLDAAFRLSTITNVPVEKLVQWDRYDATAQLPASPETEVQ